MVAPRVVVAVFLLAQLCDGIFTYMAIQQFGMLAEGNPLLVTWMALVGPQPALIGAKLLASACGVLLYSAHRHSVLGWLTLLYGAVAVGPWVAVFHHL
jgi:arginine exporter protein ArgO